MQQHSDPKNEIESLEFQIQHYEKMLDSALTNDVEFHEAKKFLHTVRLLNEKIAKLKASTEVEKINISK